MGWAYRGSSPNFIPAKKSLSLTVQEGKIPTPTGRQSSRSALQTPPPAIFGVGSPFPVAHPRIVLQTHLDGDSWWPWRTWWSWNPRNPWLPLLSLQEGKAGFGRGLGSLPAPHTWGLILTGGPGCPFRPGITSTPPRT